MHNIVCLAENILQQADKYNYSESELEHNSN